jgi:hypothetical protein
MTLRAMTSRLVVEHELRPAPAPRRQELLLQRAAEPGLARARRREVRLELGADRRVEGARARGALRLWHAQLGELEPVPPGHQLRGHAVEDRGVGTPQPGTEEQHYPDQETAVWGG